MLSNISPNSACTEGVLAVKNRISLEVCRCWSLHFCAQAAGTVSVTFKNPRRNRGSRSFLCAGCGNGECPARSPQPGVHSQESTARSPQPGVHSQGSTARTPHLGVLSQKATARSAPLPDDSKNCLGSRAWVISIFILYIVPISAVWGLLPWSLTLF